MRVVGHRCAELRLRRSLRTVRGEVRCSDKPWLKVGSWLSVSTSGIADCRCLGPREGWGGGSRVLSITVVTSTIMLARLLRHLSPKLTMCGHTPLASWLLARRSASAVPFEP